MMRTFAFASLAPAVVLIAASLFGGVWPALALTFITVMVFLLDKLTGDDWALPTDATGNGLSMLLGFTHFAVLGTVVWAVGGGVCPYAAGPSGDFGRCGALDGTSVQFQCARVDPSAPPMSRAGWVWRSTVPCFLATMPAPIPRCTTSMPRQIRTRTLPALTKGFTALHGARGPEATAQDCAAENMARARAAKILPAWRHPYLGYGLGTLASLLAAFALAGLGGCGGFVHSCAVCDPSACCCPTMCKHYGLRRTILADGRPEPIGPHHAWNAPHWYSSAMMLNAPRHSDHHMHPARTFPALELSKTDMPMLPQSLPMMAVIALFPPIWKKMMNPRVAEWTNRPARRKTAQDIAPKDSWLRRARVAFQTATCQFGTMIKRSLSFSH